jgi:hypothetical protein
MSPATLPQDSPAEAGYLLSASTVPLCAVCRSDCAPSRGKPRTAPLDGARLRGHFCAAGRLRRKQAIKEGIQTYAFLMGISNCR